MSVSTRQATVARAGGIKSERGQVVVLTAVVLAVLVGVTALVLDGSFMYNERNRLFAAADAAAKAAAMEYHLAPDANLQAYAEYEVSSHGFTPGAGTTVTVNRPPLSGAYTSFPAYVEVIVSKDTNTFLGNTLGIASMTPTARAVAGTANPIGCLVTQQDLSIGNSTLTLNGCGAAVGRNLNGNNPNARITGTPTPDVSITGTCVGTCGSMGNKYPGAPKPIDPLSTLTPPSDPGGCRVAAAEPLPPGCYLSIPTTVNHLTGGGLYYVKGLVDIGNNDVLIGNSGLLLFLAPGGQLRAANNTVLTLAAQTSGPYSGIALYQDPSNGNDFQVSNSLSMTVTGAIYMPGADVHVGNGMTINNTGCTIFVAHSITFNNGSGGFLSNSSCGSFAGAAFLGISLAE